MPAQAKKATDALISPRTSLNTAKKQRAFHSAKDYETSASQLGDVVAPPPSERRKASVVVADYFMRNDLPQDEIVEILMMLGIHPSQPDWDDGPTTSPGRSFTAPTGRKGA